MIAPEGILFYIALILIILKLVGTTLQRCPKTGNNICLCNDIPLLISTILLLIHHYSMHEFRTFGVI